MKRGASGPLPQSLLKPKQELPGWVAGRMVTGPPPPCLAASGPYGVDRVGAGWLACYSSVWHVVVGSANLASLKEQRRRRHQFRSSHLRGLGLGLIRCLLSDVGPTSMAPGGPSRESR